MPAQHDDTLLIFRIDCIPVAVPAASVQTIVMPPEHLTQPPGSNKARPGIFRHAEHVYSVVDLHQRFGIDTPRNGTGRLLLHENGIRRHALWVDEVVGLVRSEEGQWAQLPPYLPRTLFHGGFLYQKEIILCTTLEALLAMHDAEPIRRHLESLRRATEASKPVVEEIEEEKIAVIVEEAGPVKPASPPPAEIPPTPKKAIEQRPTPAAPVRRPMPPPRPVVVASRPRSVPLVKPAPKTVAVHTEPQVASTPPPQRVNNNSTSLWWLWLLIALLLLGGLGTGFYLFMDKPEKEKKRTPRPTITQPKAEPRPAPAPTPPVIVPAPIKPPVPVVTDNTSAIQISQDEEGTISLIIQRDQLRGAETKHATVATDTEDADPLLPDADWPVPTALPEPCDCTHIVVKGDTLWAIAKRYTNNAYNYPELARQSGIRNPHRIYPGNTVRIIVR